MADRGRPLSAAERKALTDARKLLTPAVKKSIAENQKKFAAVRLPEQNVFEELGALQPIAERFQGLSEAVARIGFDSSASDLAQRFRNSFPQDFEKWFRELNKSFERFTDKLPDNVMGELARLDDLAVMAATDGIAVAWSLPETLIDQLLAASSMEERLAILLSNRALVEDHCQSVLEPVKSEWSIAINDAIQTSRVGPTGPAQSHLANVIDSVVLAIYRNPNNPKDTSGPRKKVLAPAREPLDLEVPLLDAVDQFVVMPFARVFEQWWPGSADPGCMNRHATSHAVGEPGIFDEAWYLLALLLSTSIVRHFSDHPRAL